MKNCFEKLVQKRINFPNWEGSGGKRSGFGRLLVKVVDFFLGESNLKRPARKGSLIKLPSLCLDTFFCTSVHIKAGTHA
jgi:hypothetical protein